MNPTIDSPIVREYLETGRSESCPIIDLHGHWGHFYGGYLPAAKEPRMVHALQRAGVRKIVCSAHDALFAGPAAGNIEMARAVREHPGLVDAYWVVNPNYAEEAARAAEDIANNPEFVGFKFLPDYHVYELTGAAYQPALEWANERSLPILVHTWGGSAFNSPQHVERIAGKYPNARLLMGHCGYGDWETSARLARKHPNVYLELTAVYTAHDFANQPAGSGTPAALMSCLQVNGIIEYFVEQCGSEKVVYGTDMPWYSPHFAAGAVLFARIDDNDRHNILHRNAERILRRV